MHACVQGVVAAGGVARVYDWVLGGGPRADGLKSFAYRIGCPIKIKSDTLTPVLRSKLAFVLEIMSRLKHGFTVNP